MENIIKEIEESFRNGEVDNRIGFLRGNFETFEEWMVVNFKLNKYYDIESEVYSEEETQKNITRLNNVIFEECVERLRLELNL
jgi:hypothetical protein